MTDTTGIVIPITADTTGLTAAQAKVGAACQQLGESVKGASGALGGFAAAEKSIATASVQASGGMEALQKSARGTSENILKSVAASNALTGALGEQAGTLGKVIQTAGAFGQAFAAGGPILVGITALTSGVGLALGVINEAAERSAKVAAQAAEGIEKVADRLRKVNAEREAFETGGNVNLIGQRNTIQSAKAKVDSLADQNNVSRDYLGKQAGKAVLDGGAVQLESSARTPEMTAAIEAYAQALREGIQTVKEEKLAGEKLAAATEEAESKQLFAAAQSKLQADTQKALASAQRDEADRLALNAAGDAKAAAEAGQAHAAEMASRAKHLQLLAQWNAALDEGVRADQEIAAKKQAAAQIIYDAAVKAADERIVAQNKVADSAKATTGSIGNAVAGKGGSGEVGGALLGGLGAAIGGAIAPGIGTGIGNALGSMLGGLLGDGLDRILKIFNVLEPVVSGIAVLFEGLAPLLTVVKAALGAVGLILSAFQPVILVVATALGEIIMPVAQLAAALTPVIQFLAVLLTAVIGVALAIDPVIGGFRLIAPVLTSVFAKIGLFFESVKKPIMGFVETFYNVLVDVQHGLLDFVRGIPGFGSVGEYAAYFDRGNQSLDTQLGGEDSTAAKATKENTAAVKENTKTWGDTLANLPSGYKLSEATFASATAYGRSGNSTTSTTTNNYALPRSPVSDALRDLRRQGVTRSPYSGNRQARDDRN